MTYGWQSPLGDANQTLVVSAGAGHCAQFTVAKRLLPLDVIRQTVAERVAQQEQEQGIAVSKRERKRMLEEAHFELLPKAFVQKKSCTVLWDWENQMMYVSTAQQGLLDHLSASLAFCLPGWMIKLCKLEQNIERTLTGWLKDDTVLPSEMQWGEACQLADLKIASALFVLPAMSCKVSLSGSIYKKACGLSRLSYNGKSGCGCADPNFIIANEVFGS